MDTLVFFFVEYLVLFVRKRMCIYFSSVLFLIGFLVVELVAGTSESFSEFPASPRSNSVDLPSFFLFLSLSLFPPTHFSSSGADLLGSESPTCFAVRLLADLPPYALV